MPRLACLALAATFLLLACEDRPAQPPPAETTAAAPSTPPPGPGAAPAAPGGETAPAARPAVAGAAKSETTPGKAASPVPAAPVLDPAPAPKPTPSAPAPATVPVAAPTPTPTLAPTLAQAAATPAPAGPSPTLANNGHTALGAEKCKMCHRVQYDSWLATAHAKKGLDCEACHGNGADYKGMSVMRDPAAAKAAGLVLPGPDFCRKCHGAKADAVFPPKAHAHKAK